MAINKQWNIEAFASFFLMMLPFGLQLYTRKVRVLREGAMRELLIDIDADAVIEVGRYLDGRPLSAAPWRFPRFGAAYRKRHNQKACSLVGQPQLKDRASAGTRADETSCGPPAGWGVTIRAGPTGEGTPPDRVL
ncbi:hypothetical protein AB4Z43_33265 [Mesorhizobium sp. 2RAF45]|uniref:hypothetical protein n=1 Tax=Mesorhizobium sp. 2RAF45 TaxID=3233001 RepID=UPI003F97C771